MSTFSGQIAKNSVAGLFRYTITVPILLAITPFILHQLGPEIYGIWALFGVVTAYADLSDLGISSSLVRFIAQYKAEGDEQAVSQSVSTVLVIYLITGGVVTVLILLCGKILADEVFKLQESYLDEAIFVIAGAAIAFFISLLAGTFGSVIQGLQRMDLWNARSVIFTILDTLGAVLVLTLGYGLRGLVISRILACIVIGLVNWWTAYRIMPTMKISFRDFSLKCGKEIIGYSINIMVSKIARMAREPLSRIILLRVGSLMGMTYFDLGARIAGQARGLFVAMLTPLLPASSSIQTIGGIRATRHLYYRSTRYVILAIFPIFGGLIVLAKPIIETWIGAGYEPVIVTLQALLIAHFFAVLSSPAFTIMEGIGLAKVSAVTSLVSAFLNIVLCIGLGVWWGYVGVLAGYCMSLILTSVVTQVLFHFKLAVSFGDTLHVIPVRAIFVNCCAMVISGLLASLSGFQGIMTLLVSGSVYLALCIFGTLVFGCLQKEELNLVKNLLVNLAR